MGCIDELPVLVLFRIFEFCASFLDCVKCVSPSFWHLSEKVLRLYCAHYGSQVLFVTLFRSALHSTQRLTLLDVQSNMQCLKIVWQHMMQRDISDSALLVNCSNLYVIGGCHHSNDHVQHSNDHVQFSSNSSFNAEVCDLRTHDCQKLSNLKHSRRRCAVAMDKNGVIYCFGGHAGGYFSENPLSKCIEVYEHQSWRTLEVQLPFAIWHCQTVTIENEIYIFGLCMRAENLFTANFLYEPVFLCFNTKDHKFRTVRQMKKRRPWCAICRVFEKIYAIAGSDLFCKSAEVYDMYLDRWTDLPDLCCHVQALGVSVKNGAFAMPLMTNASTLELYVFHQSGFIQIFNWRSFAWRVHDKRLHFSIAPKPHIYGQTNVLQNAVACNITSSCAS